MTPLIKNTIRKPARKRFSALPQVIVFSSTLLMTPYALAAPHPTAGNDELTTPQDTPLTILPLANDTGDGLTITAVNESSTQGSTLVIIGTDKISYTPSSTASGEDIFWYQITDSEGLTNAAKVTIEVTAATQVVQTSFPTALNDTSEATLGEPITISPLVNDTGNQLTLTAVNEYSTQGSTQVIVGTDKIVYTPSISASGEDVFWYQITDSSGQTNAAKVTVTVTSTSQTAAPVTNNDNLSTSQGSPLTISPLVNDTGSDLTITAVNEYSTQGSTQVIVGTNQILYTPSSNASGADEFWYQVTDSQGRTNAAKVTVAVTGEASGAYPTAGPDSYTIDKNSTNNVFDVFANDTGAGLTFETLYAYSQQGGLTRDNNGSVQYTPAADFVGTDEFWYSIKDSIGRTNAAKVTINVVDSAPPPPPPTVAAEFSLLRTGSKITSALSNVPLTRTFDQTPYVFAQAVTRNEGDLFTTRVRQVTNNRVRLHLQEDASASTNVTHAPEDVMVFASDDNRLLDNTGAVIGELGQVGLVGRGNSADINFKIIRLSQRYENPVVIASVASANDTDPALIRVHEVTNNSFKIALREWPYQDGTHTTERVNYMVVEAGLHRLEATDYTLRAGTFQTRDKQTKKVDFGMKFVGDPAVFSQVMSTNGYKSVATTQSQLTERSIVLRMHMEKSSNQIHPLEKLGYVAIGRQSVADSKLSSAARLLSHGAMGASMEDINRVAVWGENWWLNDQRNLGRSKIEPYMNWVGHQPSGATGQRAADPAKPYFTSSSTVTPEGLHRVYGANISTGWMRNVVYGKDQLRQRINFHLSQLFVVSYHSEKYQFYIGQMVANYFDTLGDHAFGNFRDLLGAITYHSVMGDYLTYLGSTKAVGDAAPDENYAREIMQLFTIGLWELNNDGSRQLDSSGNPIPTYGAKDVAEMAKVFTGLHYGLTVNSGSPMVQLPKHRAPLKPREGVHDTGPKVLFTGKSWKRTIPAGSGTRADINMALDALFQHHNTPVYFAHRFIQYLVTSNPSPGYIRRVSAVFRNNGKGVRGDIYATVVAILTDPEAQNDAVNEKTGKLQEPLLRLSRLVKAFNAGSDLPRDRANGIYWWEPPTDTIWPQLPMFSPSVFNFFSPFNQPTGELSREGLLSPEMHKHDVATAVSIPNRFADMIDNRIHRMHPDVTPAFKFNFGPELSLEGDPAKLLDRLNILLCNGDMTDETYARIKRTLDESTEINAAQRTKFAVWLVATSADAAILK